MGPVGTGDWGPGLDNLLEWILEIFLQTWCKQECDSVGGLDDGDEVTQRLRGHG